MDVFTAKKRSDIMRRVRSQDTKPEIAVRRLVSALGFRYRLHSNSLVGHPDMVFGRFHKGATPGNPVSFRAQRGILP